MKVGELDNVLRRTIGSRVYYFGSITSDKVRDVTFVPVLEKSPKTPLVEEPDQGYQRPGAQARMHKFKTFLKDNPSSIVPPVLLSGRGNWKFVPSAANSVFGRLEIFGNAAILDGQHRLGGFVALYQSDGDVRNIDFLLLENLSRDEEIKEFVVVNNTQVGVPKSTTLFIGQGIDGIENIIGGLSEEAWITWQLNNREDSAFKGRITRTKMGPEHLFQLHSVAKCIARMFKDGAFTDTEREEKLEILIKYWNLIENLNPSPWADIEKLGVKGQGRKAFEYKLLELTGFIAWSLIANSRILTSSYNASSKTVDWDRVEQMIQVLADKIDWRKDGQFENATGEVGGPKIEQEMQAILSHNPV